MSPHIFMAIVGFFFGAIHCADSGAEFVQLPYVTDRMPSPSYSGYLNVTDTKRLHYVYVESQNNATSASDPLIVWFNGGPGCSSLLGFMQEHGPFVIDDNSTVVKKNDYPWNLNANVLYLESPAGVGWSVGEKVSDYKHTDMSTSQDAFVALEQWYHAFPERRANELYISGESYGGIYVPYLAWQIMNHNMLIDLKQANGTKWNLKGIMVGNGVTDFEVDISPSFPEIAYNFNLIPKKLFDTYTKEGCKRYFRDFKPIEGPQNCLDMWYQINNLTKGLNWYDLYRPLYPDSLSAEERIGKTIIGGEERTYLRGRTPREFTPFLKHFFPKQDKMPIFGSAVSDYMNLPETRNVLHIPDSVQTWSECMPEDNTNFTYYMQQEGSIWIYPFLKDAGIRILFYSGDTDGCVGFAGTR